MAGYDPDRAFRFATAILNALAMPEFKKGIRRIEVMPQDRDAAHDTLCEFKRNLFDRSTGPRDHFIALYEILLQTEVFANDSLKPGQVIFEAQKEDA